MPSPTGSSLLRGAAGIALGAVVLGTLVGLIEAWARTNLHFSVDNPSTPALVHLACDFVAALAGGYVCALVARNPKAATVLAVIILIMALAYQTGPSAPGEPSWYRLALLLVGPAGVFCGGWLKGA